MPTNNQDELFTAIREGAGDRVITVLSQEPHLIDATDRRGSTPLILATYYGHVELTEELLARGAAIDARDAAGNTALMGVGFKGHTEVAEILLNNGADPNARNEGQSTALIFAATFNRPRIAKLLLAAGADRTLRDEHGLTARDHARNQGFRDLAGVLA